MNLLISIVIPVYNVEEHLKKCITSIINQTIKNFEVILVNDGSTDNSLKIIKEFARLDDRVKYINKDNRGVSSARNAGLKKAKGVYIYFIDADDFVENNSFQCMYKNLIEENYSMILGNFNCLDSKLKLLFTTNNKECLKNSDEVVIEYGCWNIKVVMGAFLVKKSIIENNNLSFNINTKYAEDVEFIYSCLLYSNSPILIVKDVLFNYVFHNESATSKANFDRFDEFKAKNRVLYLLRTKFPKLIQQQKLFTGLVLPKAIIDNIILLSRNGIRLSKIISFLKENNYYEIIDNKNFNDYTSLECKSAINSFHKSPIKFWVSNFLDSKYLKTRVLARNFIYSLTKN